MYKSGKSIWFDSFHVECVPPYRMTFEAFLTAGAKPQKGTFRSQKGHLAAVHKVAEVTLGTQKKVLQCEGEESRSS